MTELASSGQLRAAFIRWALVIVPGTMLLGFLSGQIAGKVADNRWFAALTKPSSFPPPATFGIVWSVLYVLMAVALVMIVTARGARGRGLAIAAWVVQFALNLAWSPLFFGAHQIGPALWLLLGIDLAVLITLVLFWRIRPQAGWLLVPYLGWVLFAALLNWQFLAANPGADGTEPPAATSRIEI